MLSDQLSVGFSLRPKSERGETLKVVFCDYSNKRKDKVAAARKINNIAKKSSARTFSHNVLFAHTHCKLIESSHHFFICTRFYGLAANNKLSTSNGEHPNYAINRIVIKCCLYRGEWGAERNEKE